MLRGEGQLEAIGVVSLALGNLHGLFIFSTGCYFVAHPFDGHAMVDLPAGQDSSQTWPQKVMAGVAPSPRVPLGSFQLASPVTFWS